MEEYQYTDYTKKMHLNEKSILWSSMNNLRLKILTNLLKKNNINCGKLLEIGGFDLFTLVYLIKNGTLNNISHFDCVDPVYSKNEKVFNFAKNQQILVVVLP